MKAAVEKTGTKGGRKGKKRAVALAQAKLKTQLAQQSHGKRFVMEKLIGSGGMCEVYIALDLQRLAWSDRAPRVALKRLLPKLAVNKQAQLALAQEFFILRNIAHEGIVRAYDLHEEEWGPCYSMELLEGATLYQKQGKAHSGFGRDGLDMAARVFGSLAYLHERGVIHGDMKPANIFLAADKRVVLFDFSVSQVEVSPGKSSASIKQGLREPLKLQAHSPLHASPERIISGRPSFPDDIYSACCTMYECIEGTHPFQRRTAGEAMELGLKPAKPKTLSLLQWSVLSRGLSFEPEQRPKADQLFAAFSELKVFSRLLTKFQVT